MDSPPADPSLAASASRTRRLAVLLPAMLVPLAASWIYFVMLPGTAVGNLAFKSVKFFTIAWPLLATALILRERFRDPAPGKRHLASLLPGVLFGLAVSALLVFLLKATPLNGLIANNGDRIVERLHDLGVAEHFLLFALFVSFVNSAIEEVYWRWFVFGQSRRLMPLAWALPVAAAAFAAHHVVVLSQFFPVAWAFALGGCVAVGGMAWSWLWVRYRSLLGSWVSHVIVDLALMWVGWEVLRGAW